MRIIKESQTLGNENIHFRLGFKKVNLKLVDITGEKYQTIFIKCFWLLLKFKLLRTDLAQIFQCIISESSQHRNYSIKTFGTFHFSS